MAVEPPFGEFTDPNHGRNVDGIPTWVVEEVNTEIRDYYAGRSGNPVRSDADEYYFVMDEPIAPAACPPIYQLPKPYCVYILKCEREGLDRFSGPEHVKRVLRNRAESLGYEYTDEWMEAVIHSGPPRYVGLSTNPYARIHEHLRIREHVGPTDEIEPSGARFTAMFPPQWVDNIEWVDTEQTAERLELETANRLYREGGHFVHPPPKDSSFR